MLFEAVKLRAWCRRFGLLRLYEFTRGENVSPLGKWNGALEAGLNISVFLGIIPSLSSPSSRKSRGSSRGFSCME